MRAPKPDDLDLLPPKTKGNPRIAELSRLGLEARQRKAAFRKARQAEWGQAYPSMRFFSGLKWIDRTPLLDHIEPYRAAIFRAVLDDPTINLALMGRAKKNWKSADLVLAAL